ncbi:META domain-containing protein [Cyanobium sp. ATX 6F1]|nr:META domain-containing protein [Cyanobium sp. ATX 6F1]
MSGHSGVNSYSGPYRLGTRHSFTAGPFVATQMGGPQPAMRAESIYLTLLLQATSYKSSGSSFTLLDGGGHASLRFTSSAK